ncbi:MAG: hypothetical protein L0Y66_24105, partial [Myxococcaceae bacterium]|nr:hypothetical protein [Myxococcaceae bacterium]
MDKVGFLVIALLAQPGWAAALAPSRPARSTRAAPKPAPAPPPTLPVTPAARPVPPARSEEPIKLAAVGLSAVNVPARVADFYTEHFAQQMVGWGTRVITPKEVQTLIG